MKTNDEQALRQIVAELEAAWNRKDSVAWAELFSEDADFIHILGGHFTGRTAIEQGHRRIFDTVYKGSTIKLEVVKIRYAGDSVAIVFVSGTLKVVQPDMPPQINARPTMIVERRDNGWEIVTFQNTMVTPERIPQITQVLADEPPIKEQSKASGQ